MDQFFATPVITSKAATNHLADIKSQHADIVQGIKDQRVRVQQYNEQQKQAQIMETQRQDTLAKESAENDRKTKELAIKQAALSIE